MGRGRGNQKMTVPPKGGPNPVNLLPPYVFIASDFDGTLLRDNRAIAPQTLAAIRKLAYETNLPFIVATGRAHPNVLHIIRRQWKLVRCYIITSHGARVYNMREELVFSCDIPAETARTIATITAPKMDDNGEVDEFPDVATSIYQGDRWFMNKHAKDLTELYEDLESLFYYELFDPTAHESYDGVYKVYFTSHTNRAALETVAARIKRLPCGEDVHVMFTFPYCLEVVAKGVDKGVALARLLDETIHPTLDPTGKLSPAERRQRLLSKCIAFGDGASDLHMLTMAGKGCVMANATPELKSKITAYLKANHETPGPSGHIEFIESNEEDGVAEKLKQVFHYTDEELARVGKPLIPKMYKEIIIHVTLYVIFFVFLRWYFG